MAANDCLSEESKISEIIEVVLKNAQRIHGRNGLDWIKIGSIRAARILLQKDLKDHIENNISVTNLESV